MRNKMLFLFKILTKVIILLLAISTFFAQQTNPINYSDNFFIRILCLDHFYNSPINITVFIVMILLIVISLFVKAIKKNEQLILHLIIILAFIVILFDKSTNHRTMMPILEGETVNLQDFINDDNYSEIITLEKFLIEQHEDSEMPKAFTSHLIIDNMEKVELNVNKPHKIGKYRLYQSTYHKIPVYNFKLDSIEYSIMPEDTLLVNNNEISIFLSPDMRNLTFNFNEQKIALSPRGGQFVIGDYQIDLSFTESKYYSGIEVAEGSGMRILLILGLLYLGTLGYCFWRKK